MKVIELLNKIAKGEEVPKKIRIREVDYNFTKINTKNLTFSDRGSNINYAYENDFENYWLDCARINEEIEIIEEEKEIEELNLMFPIGDDIKNAELGGFVSIYKSNLINIKYKIDEIIDELNKIKKEGK